MEVGIERGEETDKIFVVLLSFELKILKNDLLGVEGVFNWVSDIFSQIGASFNTNRTEDNGKIILFYDIPKIEGTYDKIEMRGKKLKEKIENCKIRMFSTWDSTIWKRSGAIPEEDEDHVDRITSQEDYRDRETRESALDEIFEEFKTCFKEINDRFPDQRIEKDDTEISVELDPNLVDQIQQFEGLLGNAWLEKSEESGEKGNPLPDYLKRIDVQKFYELLLENKGDTREIHESLIHTLFDIKMQLFFILEVEMRSYNRILQEIKSLADLKKKPYLALRKLSIDQSLIVKNRILWERVMNFVYCLGNEVKEFKVSKGGSKLGKFFEKIKGTRWEFLKFYKSLAENLNNRWRTGEVHKGSVLRGIFIRGRVADFYEINEITNVVLAVLWPNLLLILQGGNPQIPYVSTSGYRR
ncbi:MAG: hypothetical protein ACI9S8_002052 [Chlamydiales bacterium]|jgi:hypothetical protein